MTDLTARLAAAGCVAPEDEARELLADAPDVAELDARLRRREAGEPLAWITGRVQFGGLVLRVDPGVYVPRVQTEELARRAAVVLPCAWRRGGSVHRERRGRGLDAARGARTRSSWGSTSIRVAARCAAPTVCAPSSVTWPRRCTYRASSMS